MALQKEVLKAALIAGFQAIEHDGTSNTERLCDAIANAIDVYIKTGEVTVEITGGVCTLKEDITPSSTTIETEDGGGINGFTTEGIAYVDLDSFTYTGISGNDFTGVSGLTYSHLAGEDINYTLEESICPATSSPHIPCQSTGVIR